MSGGPAEGGADPAQPEHLDVLSPERHDDRTAAEAAEQADPGVTGADQGA